MIEHQVEQGTPEWFALRIGKPTASCFDKIITPAKGELSKQARGYAFKLVAETLLNRSLDDIGNLEWVARGKELEPAAVKMYEFAEGVQTRQLGFVTTDDGMIGASPDRIVIGKPIGVEIKCPAPQTHIGYMVDGFGDEYKVQVQGQMYVCKLEAVHRYSYHPEMPPVLDIAPRDDAYIAKMAVALAQFNEMMAEILSKVRERGFFAAREEVLTPHQEVYSGALDDWLIEGVHELPDPTLAG